MCYSHFLETIAGISALGGLVMTGKENLPACPVETTLCLISHCWNVLILRDMEGKGLSTCKIQPEVPPCAEYILTQLWLSLKPVLDAMCKWREGDKAKLTE